VVPRSTVFAYKGRDVNPRSVGLALNVDALVTGRVTQQGGQINIQAELVDVAHETQLWGDQYRYPVSELLSLQEQIAWQISEALRMRLTGQEKKRLKKRPTGNSEAYQEYLKGRHAWSKWSVDGFRRAIAHFDAAIARDPKYARAYAGLGDAYGVMGYYGFLAPEVAMTRAQAAAYKALELDPGLADAHATMGMTRMFYYWDWIGAEQALARAIELDPRYSTAHMLQGLLYSILARHDAAVAAARRGRDLDPLSMLMQMGVGWSLYFARRFEEALETFRGVTMVDPAYPEALSMIVGLYERMGQLERAAETLGKTSRFFGMRASDGSDTRLLAGLASSGPRGYWEARLEVLRDTERQVRDGTTERAAVPLFAFLITHAQLGELDEAFVLLEQMLAHRSTHAVFLQVDPCLDPLRGDPRFESALRRMAFPAAPPHDDTSLPGTPRGDNAQRRGPLRRRHRRRPLGRRPHHQAERLGHRLRRPRHRRLLQSAATHDATRRLHRRPHGLSLIPDDGLREIDHGRWEGLTRAEVEAQFGDEYARWEEDPFTFAPAGR
jgi:tetratricopeptide (TPR) repeat protein